MTADKSHLLRHHWRLELPPVAAFGSLPKRTRRVMPDSELLVLPGFIVHGKWDSLLSLPHPLSRIAASNIPLLLVLTALLLDFFDDAENVDNTLRETGPERERRQSPRRAPPVCAAAHVHA